MPQWKGATRRGTLGSSLILTQTVKGSRLGRLDDGFDLEARRIDHREQARSAAHEYDRIRLIDGISSTETSLLLSTHKY